jgi:hypothetical protein
MPKSGTKTFYTPPVDFEPLTVNAPLESAKTRVSAGRSPANASLGGPSTEERLASTCRCRNKSDKSIRALPYRIARTIGMHTGQ